MVKISSKSTFFSKKLFPLIWFGFLGVALVETLAQGDYLREPTAIVIPLLMMVFGVFLMKKFVWDLADEVFDGGDFLLVRKRGGEERVPLTNIMNVSASTNTNPPRITLRLVKPGRFGSEIAFSPVTPFSLNPFAKNRIAEDLIVRVDEARTRRAR